ncbi:MAG: hypothetical protein KDB07_11835, partial [Planctomycetes bacterium]|nr:hypothetical protein [Planctomycetota bacterium]
WRVSAHLDNYTFVSQEVNINMISGASKQEITLELRERRIAKIKLNAMDPDITPQSYRIHVRPSDAAQAEFKDFNTLGSYVSHNSDGMFLHRDVEAGAYILSVVFNNEVIKEQPVSYRPEGITELFVDAPAPDRSKFVEVSVVGVPPYLYSSLQYSHGYRLNGKEMKRNVYNGLIRRKDGSAWVPHYEQNGKEAPAGAEHFVEARVYGIGETRGHYTPSSGASLRLSLEEPGLLEVTFSNFDPDLDAHKGVSVRLSRVYRDGEEKVGLNGVVGQVDDFGVLFVTGLTPGEYKVNVVFRNSNGRQVNQDEGARVMIRSGHNSHDTPTPPIYTLKLQVPTGTVPNSNYNWVQIYSGNSAIGWKRLVFDQTIEIGKYPAGEYEFRIYNKKMKFQLASDMTVLFSPDN